MTKQTTKKSTAKSVLLVIFLLFIIIVIVNSFYTVQYNSKAIVKRFGKILKIESDAGLHFKVPFIDDVQEVYAGNRVYDIPTSDVITKDKKSMIADDYVVWQVTDATKYYKTLSAVDARAEERIDAAVYNATKNTISSMTQDEVIAARGAVLTEIITEAANSDIEGYGITIITAEIKALDLPEDNKEAVYERMISERENIAAQYTAEGQAQAQIIMNTTDKEVAITISNAEAEAEAIRAEGEAEYMRILSDAYSDESKADFYSFVRALDALKASMEGGDNTIILSEDSPIAGIFYGRY